MTFGVVIIHYRRPVVYLLCDLVVREITAVWVAKGPAAV